LNLPAMSLPPDWLYELVGPSRTRFSSRKAREVLGWTPKVLLEEGQKRTREWLEKKGWL